mgnify:CR=1 FL=1
MTLGQKIRAARKAKGLTQKELAHSIGAAHNSISNWENDQNSPDPDTIQKLCWALEVQPNYFFDNVPLQGILPSNILPLPETEQKPLLGVIACGSPILADQNILETVEIPKYMHADFALQCRGDSMIEAHIRDGDLAYIRQQDMVDNGQIAAVLIEDGPEAEATLKRVHYDEQAQILQLLPCNSRYLPIVITGPALNRVRILGRLVGFSSMNVQ